VTVLDGAGNLVGTLVPPLLQSGSVTLSLPAGHYSIAVQGNGVAGDVGSYAISVVSPFPILPPGGFPRPVSSPPVIAAGADAGGSPQVQVFNLDGSMRFNFFAFSPTFKGGVRVATGDVNGDGVQDIIVAAGPGGGPQVSVYDGLDLHLLYNFYAFNPLFKGGLFVGSADVNSDGFADIIVGAGRGGGAVRVYSGKDGSLMKEFHPFGNAYFGGVTVAGGDINGDGFGDVITGRFHGSPQVSAFSGFDGSLLRNFNAYTPGTGNGVFVGAGDLTGDGKADIVTGPVTGGPLETTFDGATGVKLGSFFAYPAATTVNSLLGTPGVVPWKSGLRVTVVKQADGATFGFAVAPGFGQQSSLKFYPLDLNSFNQIQVPVFGGTFIGGVYVG
jgi:hypothetical protein